ncbi:hypothetical protein COBT_003325 [Conglomerata obtusa]
MNFAYFDTKNDIEVISRAKPKAIKRGSRINNSTIFDQNLQAHTAELGHKKTMFWDEHLRNAEDPEPYLNVLLALSNTAVTYIKNNEDVVNDNKIKIISFHMDFFKHLLIQIMNRQFGQSKNIVDKLLHTYMIENNLALCVNSYDELLQGIIKFNNDICNLIDEINRLQNVNYAKQTTNQSKQEEDKRNLPKSNCDISGTDNKINEGHNGNVFYITNAYFNNTLTDAPDPKVYFKNNKN